MPCSTPTIPRLGPLPSALSICLRVLNYDTSRRPCLASAHVLTATLKGLESFWVTFTGTQCILVSAYVRKGKSPYTQMEDETRAFISWSPLHLWYFKADIKQQLFHMQQWLSKIHACVVCLLLQEVVLLITLTPKTGAVEPQLAWRQASWN